MFDCGVAVDYRRVEAGRRALGVGRPQVHVTGGNFTPRQAARPGHVR